MECKQQKANNAMSVKSNFFEARAHKFIQALLREQSTKSARLTAFNCYLEQTNNKRFRLLCSTNICRLPFLSMRSQKVDKSQRDGSSL